MSKQDTYELIEAYLNGSLSESERLAFENRLQTDPELAKETALFANMDNALNDKSVLRFQQLVQEQGEVFLDKKTPSIDKKKNLYLDRLLLALLCLVLVGAIAFLLWKNQRASPPNGQELFATYFEIYPINESLRSIEGSGDSIFLAGVRHYQDQNFTSAVQSFQSLTTIREADMTLVFYLANALLNSEPPQWQLAKAEFQKVIQDGKSIYVQDAKWHVSLILLEQGKLDQAQIILTELASNSDDYKSRASSVLEDLGY